MAIDNKYDQLIIKLLVDIATLSLFRACLLYTSDAADD